MSRWDVLIVSSDAGDASWQCRLVASFAGVRPVGVAITTSRAQALMRSLRPDLLILDLDTGAEGQDGLMLLRRMRALGAAVEVVVLAASPDSTVIRRVLQLGVLDVLLKPVAPARLHKSLGVFCRHMAMLASPIVAQEHLDGLCSNGPNAHRWIPRDLAYERLDHVREVLTSAELPVTAALVAERVGIAPVTARRYLEYLVTTGEACGGRSVGGHGRPPNTYSSAACYGRAVA